MKNEIGDVEDNVSRQRREIIEKYINGPQKGVDNWENPQYSVYATTDYYGFIHDSELTKDFLEKEAKIKKLDIKRESKWKKLMDRGDSKKRLSVPNQVNEYAFGDINKKLSNASYREELTKRVFKGIPQRFKATVWQSFLEVKSIKSSKPRVYETMLKKALAKSPDIHQIDLDVNRTFRNTTYFRERYNSRQKALLNVLAAYSMYNTEIGYCQGMSEIAGLLLMYLVEEEDVFWALSQLMTYDRWCMHGLFVAGFPRLLTFFDHLNRIMHKLLPKLAMHFEKLDILASAYALKWFMQCYLDRVPLTLFLRLWDIYLLEGEKLLIAMAYNILKMHKKRLIKMDHSSILSFLQSDLKKDFLYEDDIVIESLKRCFEELKRYKLAVPPPPGREELPKLPFGSNAQIPSEESIKQRQAEQSNPEESVRKSIRQRRQSNKDTSLSSGNRSIDHNHPVSSQQSVTVSNHISNSQETGLHTNTTNNQETVTKEITNTNSLHRNNPTVPEVTNDSEIKGNTNSNSLHRNNQPVPLNNDSSVPIATNDSEIKGNSNSNTLLRNQVPKEPPAVRGTTLTSPITIEHQSRYISKTTTVDRNDRRTKYSKQMNNNRNSYPNHQSNSTTSINDINSTTTNTTNTTEPNNNTTTFNVKYRNHNKVPKSRSLYLSTDGKTELKHYNNIIKPEQYTTPRLLKKKTSGDMIPRRSKYSNNNNIQPIINYYHHNNNNKSTPNLTHKPSSRPSRPNSSLDSQPIKRLEPKTNHIHLFNNQSQQLNIQQNTYSSPTMSSSLSSPETII